MSGKEVFKILKDGIKTTFWKTVYKDNKVSYLVLKDFTAENN